MNKICIGHDAPCYTIAEIGINHNGDIDLAKKLIKISKEIGFDAVKFQKRVPELCVPKNKRDEPRTTPWGKMTYFEYKEKIEFWEKEYDQIDKYCKALKIDWSASAWDLESIKFLQKYNIPFIKVPSDKTTDIDYLRAIKDTGIKVILSTGGTTMAEINEAYKIFNKTNLVLLHCTSLYPCPTKEINLKVINTLYQRFRVPVGFSSHHTSPIIAAIAAVYGACLIEVHVTLDRAMWGTDQAMSLEPRGMDILISTIRDFEISLGSSEKIINKHEEATLSRTIGRELSSE